ncbi:uncharacterized protein LOC124170089 [Ischnura elegans]|uniref:uncharacterized protein LOC124170089 n=1 Tax=Ischnura elegans TaxID=197161 RepID=UPI001ED8A491|nr:uncharacterized protein LOC124170089 [Ischnura elegans]
MIKSAVASRRSIEDMEEGVPMSLLTCPGEQHPLMQEDPTSSIADNSASKTDGQDDRYQHPSEAMDENILTRDQWAQAEAQQSVDHSATNGKDRFISTLNMLKELIEKRKGEKERYLFLFR